MTLLCCTYVFVGMNEVDKLIKFAYMLVSILDYVSISYHKERKHNTQRNTLEENTIEE